MKIAIEAQRLFRRQKHGMDIVALELIRELQLLDTVNDFFILTAKGPDNKCIPPSKNFHSVILAGPGYAAREQLALPARIRTIRPDLLHCTANTAPVLKTVPLILTLHDIIFLEEMNFKGSAYQNFGNLYRRYIVPNVIAKAKYIITVSEYEKERIAQRFDHVEDKVHVIHNGVASRFHTSYHGDELEAVRKKYALPPSFIFMLGNTAPKKNTAGGIAAYISYCRFTNDPLPLVIADYRRTDAEKILTDLKASQHLSRIYFPGYIPVNDMPLIYNVSSLFLYPSHRESFGLPILEAMACGVPVITSNTSAMPEVAGDAALFADPSDPALFGKLMSELLSDKQQMSSLKQKGLARASRFSWKSAAEKLLGLYKKAL